MSEIPLHNIDNLSADAKAIILQLLEVIAQKDRQIKLLTEQVTQLQAQLAQKDQQLAQALARIQHLERQLNLDSSNSGKPPAADGLKKKNRTLSTRSKSQRKVGGQPGHLGATLKQVEHPDVIHKHVPEQCLQCGKSLKHRPTQGYNKRQVIDLPPPPPPMVHEHRAMIKRCTCGKKNIGQFPAHVQGPIQYSPRIKAKAVYLRYWQHLPIKRTCDVFTELFGLPLSPATLEKMTSDFSLSAQRAQVAALQSLQQAPVKHLDETGVRVRGKLYWLHVISNEDQTHYRVSKKRKDLLAELHGTIIHDHWPAYFQYEEVEHGLCNAHHLRELKAVAELDHEDWAAKMGWLLKTLSSWCMARAHAPPISEWAISCLSRCYDAILLEGLVYHEQLPALVQSSRGRRKRRVGHNLLLRLQAHKDGVLRCLSEAQVPFSNNLAERDLRMIKLRQKVSGGFRTLSGAEIFCIIRGFLSTTHKQRRNILEAILQLCQPRIQPQLLGGT